jgi:hypothetical protein
MEGYAEGFRSVLKPVLSPTYLQNRHPKKNAYTLCDMKTPTKFVFSNIKERSTPKT